MRIYFSKSVLKTGAAVAAIFASLAGWQTRAADLSGESQAVPSPTIEEIVVTANKRPESIQDVTATVHAIGGDRLEQLQATDLADYAGYVPGLGIVQNGAPGNGQLVLRGLALPSPTALVGTYIDDTPVGASYGWTSTSTHALDMLPYDLDHIEVLEGPQGTLYGANTMGGLVKYVTRQPDLEAFSARLGASGTTINDGSGYGHDARITVNVPIVTGVFALRGSFDGRFTPGYIDFPNQGRNDANIATEQNGRIAGLVKPSDPLSIEFAALVQNINVPNLAAVTLNPNLTPDTGSLANSLHVPSTFGEQLHYYSASVNYDMGWASAVSATSYSTLKTTGAFPVSDLQILNIADLRKFTQELRLAAPRGTRFEWLVGTYLTGETGNQIQAIEKLNSDYQLVAGAPANQIAAPTSYHEWAIFTSDTWHITDAFDLNVGARRSENHQTFDNSVLCAGEPCGSHGPPSGIAVKTRQGVFNYAVSPSYHFTRDVMAYVRVASGYRPGGPNSPVPNGTGGLASLPTEEADTLTNYEAGIKSNWLDHTLQVDLSGYVIDWKKIQLTAVTPEHFSYGINGNSAQVSGFSLATLYSPTQRLHFGANVTYTDAHLSADMPANSALIGAKGDALPYAPKWTSAVTADYTQPLRNGWKGDVGFGWRYTGKRFTTLDNPGNCPTSFPAIFSNQCLGLSYVPVLAAYNAVDAHAEISDERWKLSVFVRNLTGEHPWINLAGGGPSGPILATPLEPRVIGISLDRSF